MAGFVQSSQSQEQVGIRAYYLGDPFGNFKEVDLQVIENHSRKQIQAHQGKVLSRDSTGFWSNLAFSFIDTLVGKDTIKKELKELKKEGVEPSLRKTGKRYYIRMKIGNREIICIPPREYPINPPKFFWKDTGQEISPLRVLAYWSSDRFIVEAVKEIREKLCWRYYSKKWKNNKPSLGSLIFRKK